MPDLPCLSEDVTSSALLPRLETIPKPVTTTRLSLETIRGLEQADAKVGHGIDFSAIDRDRAVSNAHY